jgi:hypothetical protein
VKNIDRSPFWSTVSISSLAAVRAAFARSLVSSDSGSSHLSIETRFEGESGPG